MNRTNAAVSGRRMTGLSAALVVLAGLAAPTAVLGDEADAKRLLKAMSDWLGAQETISFDFDATLEVVTNDEQKIGIASSGAITMQRPDKFHANRKGGFTDLEIFFDGETLTFFGKTANLYAAIEEPGSVDHLVDVVREKHHRPLPAADLLTTNAYDALMAEVTDVKDLGSGVIEGVECDSLAFRSAGVDFQIWIAHGENPVPCRYVITSKEVAHSPQYTIQFRNWKTSGDVASVDYSFANATGAAMITPEKIGEIVSDLPENFKLGEGQ